MITLIHEKFKCFSQNSYNKILEVINMHELPCSCKIKGQLIKHGSYHRTLKISGEKIRLKITRVICKSCNKTHALLPADIVPYSQISIHDHITIIKNHLAGESSESLMIENECIDENTTTYIIKKFKTFWKQALIFLGLCIKTDFNRLVSECLSNFNKQFMQIKSTVNLLGFKTYIT